MKASTRPAAWLFEEGIRPHCMFEPLYFVHLRGKCGDNERQVYDFMRSRAYLERIAKQGYTQVWLNWWKGFGLKHEQACQDQAAALFPVCKDLGLRPVCYCSFGSLTFDTLLAEEPDAVNWIARTQAGNPTSCQVTHQCFRHRPCYTSEGYLACMEKVVTRAIDAGAEGIHFDNFGMQSEPEACHCERCTRLFREDLQARYGGDLGEEIFGLRDFSHFTVPWFNQHNQSANLWRAMPPHHWAWIDFKCRALAGASRRLADFIHRRNPDCFVEINAMEGEGFAAAFWRGNDYEQYMPAIEMVCDERNKSPKLNARGAIVGPYRAKKICRSFGCAHWAEGDVVDFCEDVAMASAPVPFWKKYKHYQLRAESKARVAVLRERHSLAYNRGEPWEETLALEQYLIERGIPFDLVTNGRLDTLAGACDLLVVAGAEVMPDDVRDAIVRFAKGGGRVLFTGAAGVHDRWYRIRRQRVARIRTRREFDRATQPLNAFHELIGADPLGSGEATIRRKAGRGRVAWVRTVDVDPLPRRPENWTIAEDWYMLPRNAPELDAIFAWLLPDGVGIRVETRGRLYVHFASRRDTGEWLVHLINHEYPAHAARADVRLTVPRPPKAVVSISIDDADEGFPERKESFRMAGAELVVPIEAIRRHRTVIVRF